MRFFPTSDATHHTPISYAWRRPDKDKKQLDTFTSVVVNYNSVAWVH
jgi:hypothetical protein